MRQSWNRSGRAWNRPGLPDLALLVHGLQCGGQLFSFREHTEEEVRRTFAAAAVHSHAPDAL
jgi:hypothetical protein